jgi:hypothetical protein
MSKHKLRQLLVFYISIDHTIELKVSSVEAQSFWVDFNRNFYDFGSSRAKYVERHPVFARKVEFLEITWSDFCVAMLFVYCAGLKGEAILEVGANQNAPLL